MMKVTTSQDELTLYTLIGEAICVIQHVEDALSHSIVLKKFKPRISAEAGKLLKKHRRYTLGEAIKTADEDSLYPKKLLKELSDFSSERNWLVHRSVAHNRDEWDSGVDRESTLKKIEAITMSGKILMRVIEWDLIEFSEENGVDMSRVKSEMKKLL